MARKFVAASTQYLELNSAVLTAVPLTLACWFKLATLPAGGGGAYALVSINENASNGSEFSLNVINSGNANLQAEAYDGTLTGDAVAAVTLATNAWHHACGAFVSNSSRTVYLDGGNAVTDTTAVTPVSLTLTDIGRFAQSTFNDYLDGTIAEVAIWNTNLNASEVAALAKGVLPYRVRTSDLVAYWPLWGFASPELDLSENGRHITLNNSPTQANHAPVTMFTPKARTPPDIAAAAAAAAFEDEGLIFINRWNW